MGFEPTTPVFEGAKTVHALDRVATVIGPKITNLRKLKEMEYLLDLSYSSKLDET
jgi:hypothetical protein